MDSCQSNPACPGRQLSYKTSQHGGELIVDVDESLHVDLTGWALPIYRGELSDEFKLEAQ